MKNNLRNRLIVAVAALVIVAMVLFTININPSLLFALPPVLWPIVEIIKAISGSTRTRRRQIAEPTDENEADGASSAEGEEQPEEDIGHAEEGKSVP